MSRSVWLSVPKLMFCICCALLAYGAQADVYKYKDEKGNVLYTDKPQFLPAERLSIKSENSNIVDLDKHDEDAAPPTDTSSKQPKESAAERKKASQSMAAGKAEACNKAREDFRQRMSAQRLYEEDGKGNRRYLTEKELDASRSAAKQAMEALCN
jgi:hypothetical protein